MFFKMLNVAYRLAPGVMLVGALLLATPLPASARDKKTDYYASMIEKKIHVLLKKADALLQANQLEEARKVLRQAGALKEKLLSLLKGHKKAKKKPSDKGAHYKKILEGLKGGISALKALGCKDEARRLEQIAKDLARRLKGGDKHRQVTDHQRAMAQRQLKILRMAKHALLEGDRKDLAEQIELTMHAIELALEGKRDEAMKIPKSALKRESVARILFYASRLWHKFKNPEKAEACEKFAKELMEKRGQGREAHGKKEEPGHDRARKKDRKDHSAEHRIQRLEEEVGELTKLVRKLLAQFERGHKKKR